MTENRIQAPMTAPRSDDGNRLELDAKSEPACRHPNPCLDFEGVGHPEEDPYGVTLLHVRCSACGWIKPIEDVPEPLAREAVLAMMLDTFGQHAAVLEVIRATAAAAGEARWAVRRIEVVDLLAEAAELD